MAYWSPTRQTDMDEVFDDEAEDELVVRKEWDRAESDIRKSGYRLGLSAGEEETLQQGFDAGYRESSAVAFALGHLHGKISASLILASQPSTPEQHGDMQNALHRPDPSKLLSLLEDCTELLRTLPHTMKDYSSQFVVQSQNENINPFSARATSAQLSGGRSGAEWVNADIHSHQTLTHKSQGEMGSSNTESDGLGELTELLGVCGFQDLPPIKDPALKQKFVDLMRKYQETCGR